MRKLLPKAPDQDDQRSAPSSLGKRKRAQVVVACDRCRKRKIKCDNCRPSCTQCAFAKKECYFAEYTCQASLVSQLQVVSTTESSLKTILDHLLRSSDDESRTLLNYVREAPSVKEFAKTLTDASLLLPEAERSVTAGDGLNVCSTILSGSPGLEESLFEILPLSRWTSLATDDRYLTHCLSLFFTWDNTISYIIPRGAFMHELKSIQFENLKFCSRFLVHSVLALSHTFLSLGATSQQSHQAHLGGRLFAEEALNMLEDERKHPSITFVQGLAVLWIYQINYGDKSLAASILDNFYFFHSALRLGSKSPTDVMSFIVWGLFCFEAKISLTLTRKMRIAKPMIDKAFEDCHHSTFDEFGKSDYSWVAYPNVAEKQPSFSRAVFSLECQLAELILEASTFFAPAESDVLDYDEFKAIYESLLNWGRGPSQDFLTNHSLLPAIVFLDVTYQIVLLKLLSTLTGFHHADSKDCALSTCASYGASIISNLVTYRAAYSLRHDSWLIQACYIAATAVVLRTDSNSSFSKSVITACQLLYDIADLVPVANECLLGINVLAHKEGIDLPRPCRVIFARLAVRAGIRIIKGARIIPLEVDIGDIEARPKLTNNAVSFSDLIEEIRDIHVASGHHG